MRLGCALAGLAAAAPTASADVAMVPGVASYEWWGGCGPTAAGMIIGYWDTQGFSNLVPGSSDWFANTQAVKDVIASPGYFTDYYDVSPGDRVPPPDLHADNCVADFMEASRGSLEAGGSRPWKQAQGMSQYANYCGYPYSDSGLSNVDVLWPVLLAEINAHRPMEFHVDSNGDGNPDHFVTVVGYDDSPYAPQYYAYNTADHVAHPYPFRSVDVDRPYGVLSGVSFLLKMGGDANLDRTVDVRDLAILAFNYDGQAKTWHQGDFTGDEEVNVQDLAILAFNYNRGVDPPPPAVDVPEPAMLGVFGAMAGIGTCLRRRTKA